MHTEHSRLRRENLAGSPSLTRDNPAGGLPLHWIRRSFVHGCTCHHTVVRRLMHCDSNDRENELVLDKVAAGFHGGQHCPHVMLPSLPYVQTDLVRSDVVGLAKVGAYNLASHGC